MKEMRIPLIAAIAVLFLGVILGSAFDLQISTAIASSSSSFGLGISVIAPTIGFSGLSVIGGGFLAFFLQKRHKTLLRVAFMVLAVLCFGVSVYFAGKEIFGVNGFYGVAPKLVGYFIVLIPLGASVFLGYWLFKDVENPNAWIMFIIILGVMFMSLVPAVTGLKAIMHRPRPRAVFDAGVSFHQWWEPCRDYKALMQQFALESEEFKSFPSGHSAEISILGVTCILLPLVCPKLKKFHLALIIGSSVIVLLVMFARILAAAHFLSDVSTGAFTMYFFGLIGNEVAIRMKKLHPEVVDD